MPGFKGAQAEATARATSGVASETETGKKVKQTDALLGQLDAAKQILKRGQATGSGFGAKVVDPIKGFVGKSDTSTEDNRQLGLISGWMVSNVPRMEGPQSNFDVQNYREMAGLIGDSSVPIADRLKMLDQLERLQNKYKSIQTGQPEKPQAIGAPKFGDIVDGYRFVGGKNANPNDAKNWKKVR